MTKISYIIKSELYLHETLRIRNAAKMTEKNMHIYIYRQKQIAVFKIREASGGAQKQNTRTCIKAHSPCIVEVYSRKLSGRAIDFLANNTKKSCAASRTQHIAYVNGSPSATFD